MAESDHWEPYRAHDQVHIAIPSAVDKTAATNQPGDTQYTGGTHQEDAGLRLSFLQILERNWDGNSHRYFGSNIENDVVYK